MLMVDKKAEPKAFHTPIPVPEATTKPEREAEAEPTSCLPDLTPGASHPTNQLPDDIEAFTGYKTRYGRIVKPPDRFGD